MIHKFLSKNTFICVKFLILALLFFLISVVSYGFISLNDYQLSCIKGFCTCNDKGFPQCPNADDCFDPGVRCIYCAVRKVGYNCNTSPPQNCTPYGYELCGQMYEGKCSSVRPYYCMNPIQIGACNNAYSDCHN